MNFLSASSIPAAFRAFQNSVVHAWMPRWSYAQSSATPVMTSFGWYLKSWKTETAG